MKPILFNTDMVRATLKDRKTETRRLVKPIPPENARLELVGDRRHAMDLSIEIPGPNDRRIYTPPYLPDDILYVRETWAKWTGGYVYKADGTCSGYPLAFVDHWHPSIHMPKEAARIFLRVTDLRAERLQGSFFRHGDTVRNLAAEGIDIDDQCRECIETYGNPCCIDAESECGILDDVRDDFARLWDSTIPRHPNKFKSYPYRWKDNPWVWVISFERCEKPEEGER